MAAPATGFLSGVLNGLGSLFGVSPAPASFYDLVVGALDVLRRQIKSIQFKSAPTATPVQYGQTPDNQIIGSIGATDAESDHLSYTVTQAPQFGSVVVNPDGSYAYTPQSAFLKTGGSDTFTVGVIESNLPVKSSSLESVFGRTTDVPVTVTVKPSQTRLLSSSYTQRFNVANWSSGVMEYVGTSAISGSGLDSGPVAGTTYDIGEGAAFEVKQEFWTTLDTTQLFKVYGWGVPPDYSSAVVTMQTTGLLSGGTSTCDTGQLNCSSGGVNTIFLDKPGTSFEIPASDKAAQEKILALCDKAARCAFTVTREETGTLTRLRQISSGLRNTSRTYSRDIKEVLNFTSSTTYTKEFSVSVSASLGLSWVAAVELQASATKSWSTSRTYTDGVFSDIYGVPEQLADGTLLPAGTYRVGTVWAEEPINRVYSDATVNLGNTTWTLRDLAIDYPDPTRLSDWFVKKEYVLPDGTRLPADDVPPASV